MDFHERLTVLVAPNSAGKSTLLRAVEVAWAPFLAEVTQARMRGIAPVDVRLVRGLNGEMEARLPARLEVTGTVGGRPVAWSVTRDSLKPRAKGFREEEVSDLAVRAKALAAGVVDYADRRRAEPPVLPVIASYATGRLWSDENANLFSKVSREDTSRFRGYADSFSPSASFGFFSKWLEQHTMELVYEQVRGTVSAHEPAVRLRVVQDAVQTVMAPSGWTGIFWGMVDKKVMAAHPQHGMFEVSRLSDGTKSVMAMAADIAHRCVRLNPHLGIEAARRTPGIVLIDEIDMHLHPEWQQVILDTLLEAFPLIQFIVTTHSPQVLTTVPAACIRMLSIGPDGERRAAVPDRQTQGVSSASVLAQIQKVSPVPPIPIAADLSAYTALIQQGFADGEQAQTLRERLLAHFGANHPLMQECERLLRYQAFKTRLPPRAVEG